MKLFNTGLLLPTFKEGTVCFVSVGPHGPEGRGNSLILDFYCQHLRRVLFVLCLGALTGPREGKTFLILDFYLQHLRRVLCVLCVFCVRSGGCPVWWMSGVVDVLFYS